MAHRRNVSAMLAVIAMAISVVAAIRRPQPLPKTTPSPVMRQPLDNNTISYTAYFSGYSKLENDSTLDRDRIDMSNHENSGEDGDAAENNNNKATTVLEVSIPPNEGEVSMNIRLQAGDYLTTILQPSLSSSRMTVLPSTIYLFNITLCLRPLLAVSNSNNKPLTIALVTEMAVTQGYYVENPTLTLRWPVDRRTLDNYSDSYNRIAIDVHVVVKNPPPHPRPTPPNANVNWPVIDDRIMLPVPSTTDQR